MGNFAIGAVPEGMIASFAKHENEERKIDAVKQLQDAFKAYLDAMAECSKGCEAPKNTVTVDKSRLLHVIGMLDGLSEAAPFKFGGAIEIAKNMLECMLEDYTN